MRTLAAALALMACACLGLDNGVGLRPQMGYNAWYDSGLGLSLDAMVAVAEAMNAKGLRAAGYEYANMDDGWAQSRMANGTIMPDPERFPGGLAAFVQAMNARGFKAGVYTDRGTKTCGGHPGSQGYEVDDAEAYVAAGVEYVKEDSCNAPTDHASAYRQYAMMRDALAAATRKANAKPVFFSLCGWSEWYGSVGAALGNSWRIGPDDTTWLNVLRNIDTAAGLADDAGPGGWNDPCLLLGADDKGQDRITEQQSVTQLYMWAILPAPLLLSQTISNMSETRLQAYTNPEVIAINQDPLGRAGRRLVGGPLASSGSDPPARLGSCAATATWTLHPTTGYLQQAQGGDLCLNVDDCGTDVIGFECIASGGTCCGPSCYKNLQWTMNGPPTKAAIVSALDGSCVQPSQDGSLNLATCDGSPQQAWDVSGAVNGSSGVIRWLGAPSSSCLSIDSLGSTTNVWGRRLANGDVALSFINVGTAAATVSCDAACLASVAGWPAATNVTIRDAGAMADVGHATAGAGLPNVTLAADGGAIWRITPVLD